jgi:CRISPR system Cascade subunit CasA
MTHTFNLIDQPWIPIMRQSGEVQEVSLHHLLINAHEIQDICADTPVESAAILPLLLAILQRVFQPMDEDVWEALWQNGTFLADHIDAYLDQWYDRFDLFHPEQPFYQARDERVKPKSVLYLAEAIANTHTIFDHRTEATTYTLSPPQAARLLVTAHAFRLGGGKSGNQTRNFIDSIFARGVLFFAYGHNLFETLALNLLPYPDDRIMKTKLDDQPIWEAETPLSERKFASKQVYAVPKGYLEYLTWQTNHILLLPEDSPEGTIISKFSIAPIMPLDSSVFSPQKAYRARKDKKGQIEAWPFKYFSTDKALWRDYDTMIMLGREDLRPPAVVEWFSELTNTGVLDDDAQIQLMATGMLADQAKPIFYRREHMPLPASLLNDEYIGYVSVALKQAEEVAQTLRFALMKLAEIVLMRGGDLAPDNTDRDRLIDQWDVVTKFWTLLEPEFTRFLTVLGQRDLSAMQHWQDTLRQSARTALDEASKMSGTHAAALRGQVVAERVLNGGMKKALS